MKRSKKLILLVDDDSDYVDSIQMILEGNGYNVIHAPGEEEGLILWSKREPDLILLDLMMEDIDAGVSMALKLKALGNTAPVYMLSSVGDQLNISIDHRDLDLSGVFQKPVDVDALLRTLEARLRN